jgi:hypothetical protein
MVASVKADLQARGDEYASIYRDAHRAAVELVRMIETDERRKQDHESAVRSAVIEGRTPPTAADAALVERVISERREACVAHFPQVEEVGEKYVRAAMVGAASRALLVAEKMGPAVEAARALLALHDEAQGRIDPARSSIDAAGLVLAFKREGLL